MSTDANYRHTAVPLNLLLHIVRIRLKSIVCSKQVNKFVVLLTKPNKHKIFKVICQECQIVSKD